MVMAFHCFPANFSASGVTFIRYLQKAMVFGQTGVDLFFVLSGFLITRILLSTRDKPRFFGIFYSRRALRIFPLYFGFLALFYFLSPLINHQSIPPLDKQW